MSTLAKMSYVGFVQFRKPTNAGLGTTLTNPISVRVNSCDVKLQQEIKYPEVVDNKVDQTIFELGPQTVNGNIAFPLIHEGADLVVNHATKNTAGCGNGQTSLVASLWQIAASRDGAGRMANHFDLAVRYSDNLAYLYGGCLVNSMQFTINQNEAVSCTAEIIGGAGGVGTILRQPYSAGIAGPNSTDLVNMLSPARVVTWNDARLTLWKDLSKDDTLLLSHTEVREFTVTLNNNIERYYTLNGRLAPQDIAARKREISGTLKVMGHNPTLSSITETNQNRFTSDSAIAFGYSLGGVSSAFWATILRGVIFEIEEVSLSTGLFETSTKWRALGDCTQDFLATKLGGSNVAYDLQNGTGFSSTANFGTSTAPAYPTFTPNPNPI